MTPGHGGAARAALVMCALVSLATSACRREAPAHAGSAAAPRSRAAFTIDARDLQETDPAQLRVTFGERGAGVAWVVARADGLHVVHDGRTGRALRGVDQIALSPDGTRIAYSAQVDGGWRMVLDGDLGVPSTAAEEPVFSPESRHVAYVATIDGGKRVVVDRSQGPTRYDVLGAPAFGADSTLVAYVEIAEAGQPPRLAVSDLALRDATVRASGV